MELSTEYPGPVPSLSGDARRLRQVLLNLLSNAIKFTEPGGLVSVRTSCGSNADVIFTVRDTGIGMTAAEISTALDRFGQVDGGFDRRHQGTGLGLPLARSFVQLHGGSLDVDSVKGKGTTVTVTIPAARVFPHGTDNMVAAKPVAEAKMLADAP